MIGAKPFKLPEELVDMARAAGRDLAAQGTPAIPRFAGAIQAVPKFASEAALLGVDYDATAPALDADDNAWLLLASCGYMEACALLDSETADPGYISPYFILQLIKKADSCAALGGRSDIRVYPLLRSLLGALPGGTL